MLHFTTIARLYNYFKKVLIQNQSMNHYSMCGRHSSVDLSAPTILRPWVWMPNTKMLFKVYIKLWFEKDENKQKRPVFAPIFKRIIFENVFQPFPI